MDATFDTMDFDDSEPLGDVIARRDRNLANKPSTSNPESDDGSKRAGQAGGDSRNSDMETDYESSSEEGDYSSESGGAATKRAKEGPGGRGASTKGRKRPIDQRNMLTYPAEFCIRLTDSFSEEISRSGKYPEYLKEKELVMSAAREAAAKFRQTAEAAAYTHKRSCLSGAGNCTKILEYVDRGKPQAANDVVEGVVRKLKDKRCVDMRTAIGGGSLSCSVHACLWGTTCQPTCHACKHLPVVYVGCMDVRVCLCAMQPHRERAAR
jgi:hypothetical protein